MSRESCSVNSLVIHQVVQHTTIAESVQFDLAIGFVGTDERSVHVLKLVEPYAKQRIVFVERKSGTTAPSAAAGDMPKKVAAQHPKVKSLLKQLGKHELRYWIAGEAIASLELPLSSWLAGKKDDRHIFVDVSAFPRSALAVIFDSLRRYLDECGTPVRVTIGYCPAVYADPNKGPLPSNNRVAPVHHSFAGWTTDPTLPVELIVGLGYEKGKALGAVEYIQPSHWRLFVPNSEEERFLFQVQKQNAELIDNTLADSRFDYDVLDPIGQLSMLSSMLSEITKFSRPVLLPFGPKIFFAICLLAAMRSPSVAVWHVSGEDVTPPAGRMPSGRAVYLSFTFARADSRESEEQTQAPPLEVPK